MDARDILFAVRRSWRAVVIAMALGMICATLLLLPQPQVFTATATVTVSDPSRVLSVASITTSELVVDPSAREVGLDTLPPSVHISATSPAGTSIVRVRVDSFEPEVSVDLADAIALRLTTLPNSGDVAGLEGGEISLVESAAMPARASSPIVRYWLLGGAAVGLSVGLVIALVREYRRREVFWPRDIAHLGSAALAVVSADRSGGARNTPPRWIREALREGSLELDDFIPLLVSRGFSSVDLIDLSEGHGSRVGVFVSSALSARGLNPYIAGSTQHGSQRTGDTAGTSSAAVSAVIDSGTADCALLVVERGRTTKQDVETAWKALNLLNRAPDGVCIVAQSATPRRRWSRS